MCWLFTPNKIIHWARMIEGALSIFSPIVPVPGPDVLRNKGAIHRQFQLEVKPKPLLNLANDKYTFHEKFRREPQLTESFQNRCHQWYQMFQSQKGKSLTCFVIFYNHLCFFNVNCLTIRTVMIRAFRGETSTLLLKHS